MNPPDGDGAKEEIVGLVLFRHEDDENASIHLTPLQGGGPHVEEHPKENWHRNVGEDSRQEHGQSHTDEDEDVCHALLSDS